MLTRLDHIVLLLKNTGTTLDDYKTLLGVPPQWNETENQMQTSYFQTNNVGLEIMSPAGPHSYDHVCSILGDRPSALTSLAFAADDIKQSHHLCGRLGLSPTDITDGRGQRQKFRCPDGHCHGIKTFILSDDQKLTRRVSDIKLDHIVINTPNPDRAIAHYGARLGIRFALDRSNEDWGARFLFFKLDDVVLEVIHRTGKEHDPKANDTIWGLTWKVNDLEAHHKRLHKAGVKTSEIRTGRKPGTRVFTVKSHTANVPTLFLEQTPK